MTIEILFYYESRQNPNGDPGFENQPRLMSDDSIMVTDVRIKRTMRDYARDVKGETLFVDYGKNGMPVTSDKRAMEIAGNGEVMRGLLLKTFDVPLFGALVPIRDNKKGKGGSEKLTGPLQFGLSRSVNKVRVINPTIVGRFVGKEKRGEGVEQSSTLGKFYAVEYALIKVQGALSVANLSRFLDDGEIMEKFQEKKALVFECLWRGTNNLITRSKYPQRSILYVEVEYEGNTTYNDLPNLVAESSNLGDYATELGSRPFDFSKLVRVLKEREKVVTGVRLCGAEDIAGDMVNLKSDLDSIEIKTDLLQD